MRIILILLVCALLSGCGLFRKTTKVNKQLDAVSVSSNVKVSSEVAASRLDKSTEKIITATDSDDKVKVYPSPGTDIVVSPDGTYTFKADSIVSFTRRKTNQARDILKDVSETFRKTSDSLAKRDSSDKKKLETKNVERKPSSSGIFSNWIAGGVVLIGIIAFLLWYFGFRPKKPKEENKISN